MIDDLQDGSLSLAHEEGELDTTAAFTVLQEQKQRLQDAVGRYEFAQQQVKDALAEAATWKQRYEEEVTYAQQKHQEAEMLKAKLKGSTRPAPPKDDTELADLRQEIKDLRSDLAEERQKNWELEYSLRDARDEIKVLERRLKDSVSVRFQGESAEEDDHRKAAVGFLARLSWTGHENARIRELKNELKLLRKDKGKSRA